VSCDVSNLSHRNTKCLKTSPPWTHTSCLEATIMGRGVKYTVVRVGIFRQAVIKSHINNNNNNNNFIFFTSTQVHLTIQTQMSLARWTFVREMYEQQKTRRWYETLWLVMVGIFGMACTVYDTMLSASYENTLLPRKWSRMLFSLPPHVRVRVSSCTCVFVVTVMCAEVECVPCEDVKQ